MTQEGYRYEDLRKRIRGRYRLLREFAKDMGITNSTLSKKLKGESDWTRAEIETAQKLLGLTQNEICAYFHFF